MSSNSDMKFYVPFWMDHVYDDFDEWAGTWTTGFQHYKFLWELNQVSPMDGVLIPRSKIEDSPRRKKEIKEAGGVKNFFDIPDELDVFGDCGAYSYRKESEPPYDPEETLEFYEEMQYDQACSVDHLINGEQTEDKERRMEITLSNARKMRQAYEEGDYSFELYGVVQGWDPDSYHRVAKELIEMGYDKLAFGGLVGTDTRDIISILQRCYPLWMDKDVDIHEFGLARWELFPFMERYGINSFDNAYHRKAWLDRKKNYELTPENEYTAVRIPIADQYAEEREPKEQAVFDELKRYINDESDPEDVIETLREWEKTYAEIEGKDGRVELFEKLKDEYLRTLREKPWEKCNCHICDEYGLHVCIFRRNERNMRRGFHNLYRFYHYFNGYLEGEVEPPQKINDYSQPKEIEDLDIEEFENESVLVITSCSKTKKSDSPGDEMPAEELYQGRLVQNTRGLCKATGWDHRIISAKYGLVEPEEVISPYEETLESVEDSENLRPKVLPELAEILDDYDRILVIAGKYYRRVIEPLYDNRVHILNSAGYPVLCSKIKEATPDRESKLEEY